MSNDRGTHIASVKGAETQDATGTVATIFEEITATVVRRSFCKTLPNTSRAVVRATARGLSSGDAAHRARLRDPSHRRVP